MSQNAYIASEVIRELADRLIHQPNDGYDEITELRDQGLMAVDLLKKERSEWRSIFLDSLKIAEKAVARADEIENLLEIVRRRTDERATG